MSLTLKFLSPSSCGVVYADIFGYLCLKGPILLSFFFPFFPILLSSLPCAVVVTRFDVTFQNRWSKKRPTMLR